jgi:hypothetical protein
MLSNTVLPSVTTSTVCPSLRISGARSIIVISELGWERRNQYAHIGPAIPAPEIKIRRGDDSDMVEIVDRGWGMGVEWLGSLLLYLLVEVVKCSCCVMEDTDVGTFPRNAADPPRIVMSPLRNGAHRDSGGASWAMYWAICITVYIRICGIAMNSRSLYVPARVCICSEDLSCFQVW